MPVHSLLAVMKCSFSAMRKLPRAALYNLERLDVAFVEQDLAQLFSILDAAYFLDMALRSIASVADTQST